MVTLFADDDVRRLIPDGRFAAGLGSRGSCVNTRSAGTPGGMKTLYWHLSTEMMRLSSQTWTGFGLLFGIRMPARVDRLTLFFQRCGSDSEQRSASDGHAGTTGTGTTESTAHGVCGAAAGRPTEKHV